MKPPDLHDDRLPLVPFVPFRCPRCTAAKPVTYGSTGRVRYHRCQNCGTKFRSLELEPSRMGDWDAGGPDSAQQN